MNRFAQLATGLALMTCIWGGAALADTIELRADYWCPFNCEPDSDRPGFVVEIASEALGLYGHTVNYELMNWSRSLEYARTGRINGVIGTDEDEAPFLILGPTIADYREAFVFRAGEGVDPYAPDGFDGLRMGAIADYDYTDVVNDYLEDNAGDAGLAQLLSGDDALEQNLRKLQAGRIDVFPEERSVLLYTLDSLGLTGEFDIVLDPEIWSQHIGFSPELESSALYIEQLTAGIEQMRDAGRIDEIMRRYGLAD